MHGTRSMTFAIVTKTDIHVNNRMKLMNRWINLPESTWFPDHNRLGDPTTLLITLKRLCFIFLVKKRETINKVEQLMWRIHRTEVSKLIKKKNTSKQYMISRRWDFSIIVFTKSIMGSNLTNSFNVKKKSWETQRGTRN